MLARVRGASALCSARHLRPPRLARALSSARAPPDAGTLGAVSELLDLADREGMAEMANGVQEAELPVLEWFASQLAYPTSDSEQANRMMELTDSFSAAVSSDLVHRVPLKKGSRVLELGFGGGSAITAMARRCSEVGALVIGVDMSHAACESARAALEAEGLDQDCVQLRTGSVADYFPFDDGYFDVVYHLNCWYFWTDLDFSVSETARVLRPRGVVLTGTKLGLLKALFGGRFPEVSSYFKNVDMLEYTEALERANMREIQTAYLNPLGDASPITSYTLTTAKKPRAWAFKPVLGPDQDCRAIPEPGSWPPYPP